MKAEELDKKFDDGEDVLDLFDLSTLKPTFSRLFRTKNNNCGRKRQETAKLDSVYQRV